MLKLVFDGRRGSLRSSKYILPQYIILQERLLTLGRGYKADIKILLPFISRRHLSVSEKLDNYKLHC